jgi:exodeoxyribonuclease X
MSELSDGLVILDTETTDRENGEVIELAYGVAEEPLSRSSVWHFKRARFEPVKTTTFGALAVHHILPSELAGLPASGTALSHVPPARYWVGHNIDFDWMALGSPPGVFRICTLALARKWYPDADSHSLGALIYYLFGATEQIRDIVKGAHGAVADVRMTQMLFYNLLERTQIETLSGLFSESEDARVPRKWNFGKFADLPISSADRGYAAWFTKNCKDRPDYPYYIAALKRVGLL